MRVFAMELFTKLFGDLLLFVYHCFDRIVIHVGGWTAKDIHQSVLTTFGLSE